VQDNSLARLGPTFWSELILTILVALPQNYWWLEQAYLSPLLQKMQYVFSFFFCYNSVMNVYWVLDQSPHGRRQLEGWGKITGKYKNMKLYLENEDCVIYVFRPGCILVHIHNRRPGFLIWPILLLWRTWTTHIFVWLSRKFPFPAKYYCIV